MFFYKHLMRVLFFPWFGSKAKHVERYSSMYRDLFGSDTVVDVVRYQISDAITFAGLKRLERIPAISKSYDCAHMVSGGCLVGWKHLTAQKVLTKQVIFDSGPFFPCSDLTANYMQQQFGPPSQVLAPLVRAWWSLEGYCEKKERARYDEWLHGMTGSLCLLDRTDPFLFLDPIDQYLKKSKSNEIRLDAPHAFLLKDPRYREAVRAFLSEKT